MVYNVVEVGKCMNKVMVIIVWDGIGGMLVIGVLY